MNYLSLFFIFVSFQLIHSVDRKYFKIDEIFQVFDGLKTKESDLKIIVDSLSSLFEDAYAFNEIAKNPPQPSFNSSYHGKVDIQQNLKDLNLKDISMYKFYQEIKLLFDRLKDKHLSFKMKNFTLENLFYVSPYVLAINEDSNNITRMFASDVRVGESEYSKFKNYDQVFKMIKKNKEIPIREINGLDPFDYISNFGGEYENFRSPHASFRIKFFYHNRNLNFLSFPLNKEDLSELTVTYDNGDSFTTDFMIYTDKNITLKEFSDNIKLFFDNTINNLKKKDEIKRKDIIKDIFIIPKHQMYIDLFDDDYYVAEVEKEKKKVSLSTDNYWKYNYNNLIACRVDNDKKINMYGLTSFGSDNGVEYILTIKKCTKLFDENTYPIIVVNVINGGGLVLNSHFLLESLSPYIQLHIYHRMRKTDNIQDNIMTNALLALRSVNVKNCENDILYSDALETKQFVDYNNSVNDTLLGPFLFDDKISRSVMNELKENIKNPRKPTEILVFTDGFSFSATSLLIKHLQYYGGGITAGYFVNPNLDTIPFDSSLSPSSIISDDLFKLTKPKGHETLSTKYGYSFVMAATQTFYTEKDYQVPLEFKVTPVDEKVNIYINNIIKNPEDLMDKSIYDSFIDDSLKIFEKYKTKCNPDNKKLLLLTSECDGKFGEHTHGGYECGDDGVWTKNCVASYCDIGYFFDFEKKQCIYNVCNPGNSVVVKLILVILLLVLAITACVAVYIYSKKTKGNEIGNLDENKEAINLTEGLN